LRDSKSIEQIHRKGVDIPLSLLNLDQTVRELMIKEIEADISAGRLYVSRRLSPSGVKDYPALLKEAVQSYDDFWLTSQLAAPGRLNATETRNTKRGAITAKLPYNAPEMLAEGEFNRFYLRALCLLAMQSNVSNLIVYRAKEVINPRPESQSMIGKSIDPEKLLADLRANPGVDTALGLPAGPNSGLSAKLP